MATTSTFQFTLLSTSDTAGYSSINALINSVDTKLRYRMPPLGSVMMWDSGATGTYGALPTGWESLGNTVSGLPTLSNNYVYIRKTTSL